MGSRFALPVLVLLLLGLAAACGGSGDSADSADPAPGTRTGDAGAVNADARDYYDAKCARCHGPAGRGDGPMGRNLNPGPRDYSDPEWQASVTDEYLGRVIVEGGRPHQLNPMMPAHADLADRPEIVTGLVQLIRSFSR